VTGLAQTLQVALVTKQSFDVGVEVNKAGSRINDRGPVVDLDLSGREVLVTLVAPVVLCQSSRLHVGALLGCCLFKSLEARRILT
jgi:hypothetical protein